MKTRRIIGWVLTVLLVIAFLLSAAGKLTGVATPLFVHWGYPAWFARVIGVLELAGVLGLLISKTVPYAILGLTVIMVGAAYTHLANHEGLQVLRPIPDGTLDCMVAARDIASCGSHFLA